MGYFPNGTSGMDYEEQWCLKCVHHENCAVWLAHMLHNYDECNNPDSILHMLIPLSKNGLGNEKCRMFHEAPNQPHPDQLDLEEYIRSAA